MLSKAGEFGSTLIAECQLQRATMNEDQTMQLLSLIMMKAQQPLVVISAYRDLQSKDGLTKIMHDRVRWALEADEKLDPALMIFFRLLCERPADAVMLAAVVCYMRDSGIPLTVESATHQIFPLWVPNRAALTTTWDEQKVRAGNDDRAEYRGRAQLDTDNQLDIMANWKRV